MLSADTAPTDEGLRSDIAAVKAFGLNLVRLHQKVNPERWYTWADRLGIIVYQDAVQHFGDNPSLELFTSDLVKMIADRYSHPCIVQYDIFNEGDCIKDFLKSAPETPAKIVELVRGIDPSRLIDINSGGPANEFNVGDVFDIHDYGGYLGSRPRPKDPKPTATQYAMIGEFGGLGAFLSQWQQVNGSGKCRSNSPAGSYGHGNTTPTEAASSYIGMTKLLAANKHDISASVYTQITDVENECDVSDVVQAIVNFAIARSRTGE
jgi:beta-galactosidase/beta-glucuronidase